MGSVVSIQSYRGGTGKSNLTANLACALADMGFRVAVLDSDLQSPGVHVIFGFDKSRLTYSLTDFLYGKCEIEEVAYDVSSSAGLPAGRIHLLPSSLRVDAIMRVISEGYDVGKLNGQFASFMKTLAIDFLLLDTHPGINRETMLTTAVSDVLIIIVRPDQQDFHGTAVLTEVAGRLKIPRTYLVANKVLPRTDQVNLVKQLEGAFKSDCIGVLPLSEEMASLGSAGLFLRRYPTHALSAVIRQLAERLVKDTPTGGTSPHGA
jgi:MinD-like ATPase involved in chromosome partitioning or flagellar assembly